jgi:hypothetical protein
VKSKLISRGAKLKLSWSVVRPTLIYACETWALKESETNKLLIFVKKILTKNFGPSKENNQLINYINITNFIRARSLMAWPQRANTTQQIS